ncbi:pilus assembly protein CpaB [Symbiobacterium terraclitae]|uniref:Pilus assembly protein CpaB n=1 Tax=Symbiobacterium terraclitae TaxID=557451 RepID=A0ABS4JUD4_9FIRM|nr:Flp pilus assembly protein CpaB [Symbiobacterium terraclitae]MBP2019169.1 pilus assembly protein CpaB [Symbiobacterium terraclitae]
MRGNAGRLALAGAFICALLAAWFNIRFLEMQQERIEVLTVTQEVEPYTAVGPEVVRVTALPRDAVPADAVTDPGALSGRYTRALLIPGTVLREAHLVPAGGSSLAARLAAAPSPDVRAMALRVDEATGVAGTLREGDPVDVLVAIHADAAEAGESGAGRAVRGTLARVIAQRVPVLFVQRDDLGGPAAVVLQVTPRTAEEIAFAQANGMVWLLTSPYGDEGEPVATTGVDRAVFFERYGIGEELENRQAGAEAQSVAGAPVAGVVGGDSAWRKGW